MSSDRKEGIINDNIGDVSNTPDSPLSFVQLFFSLAVRPSRRRQCGNCYGRLVTQTPSQTATPPCTQRRDMDGRASIFGHVRPGFWIPYAGFEGLVQTSEKHAYTQGELLRVAVRYGHFTITPWLPTSEVGSLELLINAKTLGRGSHLPSSNSNLPNIPWFAMNMPGEGNHHIQ